MKKNPPEKTTIEKLAGDKYQLGWDPAAHHQPGGKTKPEFREQYRLIPCRYGNIYVHSEGVLAWYSMSPRIIARAIKEAPSWLNLSLDCEGEAIFTFPVERFDDVGKWAKPKKKRGGRPLSSEDRDRLVDDGRDHRFGE